VAPATPAPASNSPGLGTISSDHRGRLTLAGKIDAILKLTVVASVLLASSSVRYYYLVHLPHRDAQFEPERVAHVVREASPNCTLPRAVALALDADVEKARDRCLEEDGLGLELPRALLNFAKRVMP
jgi:hypothetical protein